MSEDYWDIPLTSTRIDLAPSSKSEVKSNEGWLPRARCKWSINTKMALLSFFTKLSYPYRRFQSIPFEDPLRSEIRRFLVSLDAYLESPNPAVPEKDILYGATDKDFASYLKKVKRKSFLTRWDAKPFKYPIWWDDIPSYHINDIGDIFNYSYLIFWEEESEDYLEGFQEVSIKDSWLRKFRHAVEAILPQRNEFEKIDPLEILTNLSSSISIDKDGKHIPNYLIKNKFLNFSKKRGICERCVINVSPENCRDTVLNNPSDLNTISLIDQQMMEILRVMPGHIHLTDKERVSKRLKNLLNKCSFFIQRDIRKEGITKPRELLKVMLEVLHSEYPDIEIFGYTDFYDSFKLSVDGVIKEPLRGHGLGMANSLTTLMQLAIHYLINNELLNDWPLFFSKVLTINDDFTAGFKDEESLELYWDMEDEVMDGLSILRQTDKSFSTHKCFVLAERYFTQFGEYEKISYQRRELLYPLTCFNVTHAKRYFSSCQTYCNSKLVGCYIEEISNFWGYEFFPDEFRYPTICGGWITERINSVDLSLQLIDQLPYNSMIPRAYQANRVIDYKKPKGNKINSPWINLLGPLKIPEEFERNFNILPFNLLKDKFGRILSQDPNFFKRYWRKLYKERQKVFKKPFDLPQKDLIDIIWKDNPTNQYYPVEHMINKFHKARIIQIDIKDIYIDPNPHMSCLALFNERIDYPFKESYSIRFTDPDNSTKKSMSLFSKEIQRSLKSEIINKTIIGKFREIYWPEGSYNPFEQYLNPIILGELVSLIDWGKGYPEVYDTYENPLIKEKKMIYNHIFSLDEIIALNESGLKREVIKKLVQICKDQNESILDYLNFLAENMEVQENIRPPPIDYYDREEPLKWDDNFDPYDEDAPKVVVTRSMLFEDGCPVLYSYRQFPSRFTFTDPVDKELLGQLGTIIAQTLVSSYEEGIDWVNRILIGRMEFLSPYARFLIKSSGVGKILEDWKLNKSEDVVLDDINLFDE